MDMKHRAPGGRRTWDAWRSGGGERRYWTSSWPGGWSCSGGSWSPICSRCRPCPTPGRSGSL